MMYKPKLDADVDPYWESDTGADLFSYETNTEGYIFPDRRGKKTKPPNSIWTRDPSTVTDDEYNDFFKRMVNHGIAFSVWRRNPPFPIAEDLQHSEWMSYLDNASNMITNPAAKLHHIVEGPLNYKLLIYAPRVDSSEPPSFYGSVAINFKFYVHDCLLTDNFQDELPKCFDFIRGVLDTDDLPYDVGLNAIKRLKVFKLLKKEIVSKIFEMLESMDEGHYYEFWSVFGKKIKSGVQRDPENRFRLAKLLRFQSSKLDEGCITSLSEYVDQMKPNQQFIYYIIGSSYNQVIRNRILTKYKELDFEVILLTDPDDESCLLTLNEFGGKKFKNVLCEEIEKVQSKYNPLINWIKENGPKEGIPEMKVTQDSTDSSFRLSICYPVDDTSNTKKMVHLDPNDSKVHEMLERVKKNPSDEHLSKAFGVLIEMARLQSQFSSFISK